MKLVLNDGITVRLIVNVNIVKNATTNLRLRLINLVRCHDDLSV